MNNKCVYLHKTKAGIVFYVGSGDLRRATSKELSETKGSGSNRSKVYSKFVKSINFDYDVEIVAKNLTTKEAVDIEQVYFDLYRETIVNVLKPKQELILSKDELEKYFYISSDSPSGLMWKIDRTWGRRYISKRCLANTPVGTKHGSGYWVVKLNFIEYKVHRIILTLLGQDVTGKVVDHINRDKGDNSPNNLRICSHGINSMNKSFPSNNTSGIVGVRYCGIVNCWLSSWKEDGKSCGQAFSALKYGFIPAQAMATKARLEADNRLGNTVNRK